MAQPYTQLRFLIVGNSRRLQYREATGSAWGEWADVPETDGQEPVEHDALDDSKPWEVPKTATADPAAPAK